MQPWHVNAGPHFPLSLLSVLMATLLNLVQPGRGAEGGAHVWAGAGRLPTAAAMPCDMQGSAPHWPGQRMATHLPRSTSSASTPLMSILSAFLLSMVLPENVKPVAQVGVGAVRRGGAQGMLGATCEILPP